LETSSSLETRPDGDGHARHPRAREQKICWMVDAIRQGDYLDALGWLKTLVAADEQILLTSESTLGMFALGPVSALAHHPKGTPQSTDPVDGPVSSGRVQHGGTDGHLPASSRNVALVGKLKLTAKEGGIADVGSFGDYAYLNAWNPECASHGGAGAGVHVVDISDPANPDKVGFLPAEPNSCPGEGISIVRFGSSVLLVHNNETCNGNQPAVSGFSVWCGTSRTP